MAKMAELSVKVDAEVELRPGPKTVAWLVSLGWTPPAEEEAETGRWQCRSCKAWNSADAKVCTNPHKRKGPEPSGSDA